MTRLRFALLYSAAWIPAAALYSLLIYRVSPARDLGSAITGGVESIAAAALLGLVVWRLTARLAERPRGATKLIGAHVVLAMVYSVTWTLFILGNIALFAPPDVLSSYVRFGLGWQLLTGVFVYGMVAGVAHAIHVGRRLQREREATARAEALRVRAELGALRAQMNPHFLFNALHSIAALARTEPVAVEEALERLALVLRRLLDVNRSGVDHIPLGEEWDIVRDQLELEKLRFGKRLEVVASIDAEALDCGIPVFTLHPLVENAVKHGVGGTTQPCTVQISARTDGETLELEVRDDGPGADQRTTLQAPGLGLRAIRQRLLAQYGDRAGIHIETAPGKGFLVRLTLPAVAAPRAERSSPATVMAR